MSQAAKRRQAKRRQAERRGRRAELAAALHLMARGYRILAQRARTPFGEVDLAAWKSGVLVIVEVKARSKAADGIYAVTPFQQARIARAAATLAGRWRLSAAPIRFDVMVLDGLILRCHARGAWDALDAKVWR